VNAASTSRGSALPAAAWTAAAAEHADRVALVSQEGTRVTYRELAEASNRLANGLLERGLTAGERLVVLLPNGPALVQCYLACAKAGIVVVPLSIRLTAYELGGQLRDAQPAGVIYDAARQALLDEALSSAPRVSVAHENLEALIDTVLVSPDAPSSLPDVDLNPDDPYCVMYSGGTSGSPKGVIQTHRGWGRCIENVVEEWRLVPEDMHLLAFPMSHVAWFTTAALLAAGGTSILWREWNPARVLDTVQARAVTTLNMAPTMLNDLVDELDRRERELGSLRLLTTPGASLPADLYIRARSYFGDILGTIYGMTESSGPITFLHPADMASGPRSASVGQVGKEVELFLLDDHDEPVAKGGEGEICLRGPQIISSYLNRPEEQATTLRDGMLHTGDMGRLDEDGFLFIVGRKKEMIKSGGYNVYPREVEDVLVSHPDLLESAVIGVPDPRWIEAVHAVVVMREGADTATEEIIEHCRGYLSRYKVPKRIRVVDRLPRTSLGKVDKRALEASYGAESTAEVTT
jgi:acyl-CoA synthetase (AMP-forming)/AMP-acid ligase II